MELPLPVGGRFPYISRSLTFSDLE